MVLFFFLVTKVFQKGTMFWMSLCFSLTWDSVACNGCRQGFMVAWVCIAAPSPQKNSPFAAQLKIAFRRFLLLYLLNITIRKFSSLTRFEYHKFRFFWGGRQFFALKQMDSLPISKFNISERCPDVHVTWINLHCRRKLSNLINWEHC